MANRKIVGNWGGKNLYKYVAFRQPRRWSNRELRDIAPVFTGSIINVSAWKDEDKEGNFYRDYFTNVLSYSISNYGGKCGTTGETGEIFLDLSEELPEEYHQAYDTAFNHTTLEHVFEVRRAFANICKLSRDAVVLIVPFVQPTHGNETYGDFWRMTPMAVEKFFEENGFHIIYENANYEDYSSIYLFFVAVKDPVKWAGKLPAHRLPKVDLGPVFLRKPPVWIRLRNFFRLRTR
ncbi:MAG: hypothetical protein ACYC27_05550 [Armatimonadota bacterium]